MAKYDYDIGVIGGGAAGLTVASGAAQLGAKTILIEKESQLGGDCLHYGCVPSKTLIRSANVYHLLRRSNAFGLPPIRTDPVDFSSVSRRIREVIAHIQQHDSVDRFNGLGVTSRFGQPRFSDDHEVVLDGKPISARKWVIATGSEASVPDVPGLGETGVLTNREIFFLQELPESLIILGAGAIAIEMAQAFCRLGARVTVLQRSLQILSKEDKDMADSVLSVLQSEGVVFHLGCTLISARRNGNSRKVVFRDGEGREQTVTGSHILAALGRTPNVHDLGLNQAGVGHTEKGIMVDGRLRTGRKHIFAAGDVIGIHQFTHAAGYEGGIVVSNAIFNLPRKTNYQWMPRSTFCAPELVGMGYNEKRAQAEGLHYRVLEETFGDNDRAQAENATTGKLKLLLDMKDKPIGVHIFGHHASELLGEWIVLLNGGIRLSTLAGSTHPYPTLAEINKRVAGSLLSEKIFSPRVKKILKFLYRYRGK